MQGESGQGESGQGESGDRFYFGPFELRPIERLLLCDGAPVRLGGRAFDLLLCLVEREGEVVSPDELLGRVWRGVNVQPAALRVQVSALRKALGDSDAATDHVSSVAGHGYCITSSVIRETATAPPPTAAEGPAWFALPAGPARILGREIALGDLRRMLTTERLVSLVGAGGIGKTTVALSLAHRLSEDFAGGVAFVDLGIEPGDANVASAVAAALQLTGAGDDAPVDVAVRLRSRRLLLVLDSCEHVVASAAALAEAICETAPQVHILVTSRQPLNARDERVYRLAPLETPPSTPNLSFDDVRRYPATQLFVERAAASGGEIEPGPTDGMSVAAICRKLDGIPLAIELAAGQVGAFGLATTLALLDSRLQLSWPGRRTASPRHVTLGAALDWSYNLLSAGEARLLRCLSTFAGAFTLDAAEAILGEDAKGLAIAELPGLVAKSLVNTDQNGAELRYRLLDTTRVYAAARLSEAEERQRVSARHGAFALKALRALLDTQQSADSVEPYAAVIAALAEVRAALAWALVEQKDQELGVRLAAAAALAMLKTSQLTECRRLAAFALAALPGDQSGGRVEMELQTCLGLSRMLAGDNTADTDAALARSLELADRFGERAHMIPVLSGLQLYHHRGGDGRRAMAFAERAEQVAAAMNDPIGLAVAHDMLAVSHHLNGAHELAAEYSAAVLRAPPPVRRFDRLVFGFEHRNRALATIARVHWLSGRYQQAVAMARRSVSVAEELEHPASKALVLAAVLPIFFWIGDHDSISDYVERLCAVAEQHDITSHRHIGAAFRGAHLIQRGDLKPGVALMRQSLDRLEEDGNRQMPLLLGPDYIQGLVKLGDLRTAQAGVERLFRMVEAAGYTYNLSELYRLQGEVFRHLGNPSRGLAGEQFLRALKTAHRQNALAWALRTAISLFEMRADEGRPASAGRLVSTLLARFPDDTVTPDRIRAVALLGRQGARG